MTAAADLCADIVELAPYVPHPREQPAPRLHEIAFRANAWLSAEDDLLRRLFHEDTPIVDMAAALDRPFQAVRARIGALGLRRNSKRPWTNEEDAEIVERYGADSAAVIAQDLGRSVSAVYNRARLLSLSEDQAADWDAWEDLQLREGYERGVPVGQIATLIGRTLLATRSRASLLGLRHPHQPPNWTDEEATRALVLAGEGHRYLAIIEMLVKEGFPRRSKNGFGQRIRILGYGRGWGRDWTPEEEELLRRAYSTGVSIAGLGRSLSRSRHSMKWKAEDLGLAGSHANAGKGFRQGPEWTKEEDDFLRDHYGKMKTGELARHLGRPKGGVFNRAWKQLGLVHGYWRPYRQDELQAFRIAFDHGISIADLAVALDRHPMTVSKYATDKLSLHFGRRPRRKPPLSLTEILALQPDAEVPVPRSKSDGTGRGRYVRKPGP